MIYYFKVYFLLTIVINLINMVISRKKRTSLFRQRVEKEWREYYWEFILKYSDKLDWSGGMIDLLLWITMIIYGVKDWVSQVYIWTVCM